MSTENGLPVTSHGNTVTGEKSMVLGMILAFFLGGIGLAYAGRVGLGVVLFIVEIICACIAFLVIPAFIAFIIWIVALVLTYKTIKENNALWVQHLTK